MSREEVIYVLNEIVGAIKQKMDEFNEEHYYQIDGFIDDYILELSVWIPWLENRICSHRLSKRDIQAMSRKGYKIFDGDKGRFVKEMPETLKAKFV